MATKNGAYSMSDKEAAKMMKDAQKEGKRFTGGELERRQDSRDLGERRRRLPSNLGLEGEAL